MYVLASTVLSIVGLVAGMSIVRALADGTLDPARFEVRRIAVHAADGAQIPVTLVMRRGQALDGSAPLLQYGYGSYGMSMEPAFSTTTVSRSCGQRTSTLRNPIVSPES